MDGQYHYQVTETKVVSKDAVEVMAPTADYRATLITCTGDFIPLTRDYTHRLIVIAQLSTGERIP
jgi:LPXTG-site transpeptidase (sortase) family protein